MKLCHWMQMIITHRMLLQVFTSILPIEVWLRYYTSKTKQNILWLEYVIESKVLNSSIVQQLTSTGTVRGGCRRVVSDGRNDRREIFARSLCTGRRRKFTCGRHTRLKRMLACGRRLWRKQLMMGHVHFKKLFLWRKHQLLQIANY